MSSLTATADAESALATTTQLVVRQQKEWGEIVTGWETRNRYEVFGADEQPLFLAGEVGGNFFARSFLKAKRPFTLEVRSADGALALTVRRPWSWFFSRADVYDGQGRPIGTIQQRFAFLRRKYDVQDESGRVVATLFGAFFKPWTFEIRRDEQPCGAIKKQWSGLFKEAFSDADTFGIEMSPEVEPPHRPLFLGATFLIDFVHFENTD